MNDRSGFKVFRANFRLDIMEIRFKMKNFRFWNICVLCDAKQACFELVLVFKVF